MPVQATLAVFEDKAFISDSHVFVSIARQVLEDDRYMFTLTVIDLSTKAAVLSYEIITNDLGLDIDQNNWPTELDRCLKESLNEGDNGNVSTYVVTTYVFGKTASFSQRIAHELGCIDFVASHHETSYYLLTDTLSTNPIDGITLNDYFVFKKPWRNCTKPVKVRLQYNGIAVVIPGDNSDRPEQVYLLPARSPLSARDRARYYRNGTVPDRHSQNTYLSDGGKADDNPYPLKKTSLLDFHYIASDDKEVLLTNQPSCSSVLVGSILRLIEQASVSDEMKMILKEKFLLFAVRQLSQEQLSNPNPHFIYQSLMFADNVHSIALLMYQINNMY